MSQDSEYNPFNFGFNINEYPEHLRPVIMERAANMANLVLDALEAEDLIADFFTWSKPRVMAYQQAVLMKHIAEHEEEEE